VSFKFSSFLPERKTHCGVVVVVTVAAVLGASWFLFRAEQLQASFFSRPLTPLRTQGNSPKGGINAT